MGYIPNPIICFSSNAFHVNLLGRHPGTCNQLTCRATLHVAQVCTHLSAMTSRGSQIESTAQKCLSFFSISHTACLQLIIILPMGSVFSVACEGRSTFHPFGVLSALCAHPVSSTCLCNSTMDSGINWSLSRKKTKETWIKKMQQPLFRP